jgi:hypothetical protein
MLRIRPILVATLPLLLLHGNVALAQTKIIVPKNVGKEISVRGTFSTGAKLGPSLQLKERSEPVYLLSNPQSKSQVKLWFPEGAKLSATGILRYQSAPKSTPGEASANAGYYYYFDIDAVKLRQK